ncbi:hypothetical protein pb186bvf_012178 [Paramecium bursaria]
MHSLNSLHQFNETPQNIETMSQNKHHQIDPNSSEINLLYVKQGSSPTEGSVKSFGRIIIFFHIVNFYKRVQRYFRPDVLFQESHYKLIDDRACGPVKEFLAFKTKPQIRLAKVEDMTASVKIRFKYRQAQKTFFNAAEQLFNRIPIIDPSHRLKFLWDLILNLLRIYLFFLIPIMITFESQYMDQNNQSQLFLYSFVFLMDMLMRLFTIYYDHGLPVKDRYQIIRNLYSINTINQMIGIISLFTFSSKQYYFQGEFVLYQGWPKLILLFFFFQLKNLLQFINTQQQASHNGRDFNSIIDLTKLIGLVLLIQHLSSCIWVIIGQYSIDLNQPNWITSNQFDLDWNVLYINSLYFMSVTMFTVGYGDIHPYNMGEKVFCLFFMFLCTFQLSYSVNTIGAILKDLSESNQKIRTKMLQINQYIKNFNKFRVREYLRYYWLQENVSESPQQSEILNNLSDDLRLQIAVESSSSTLQFCNFFRQHFSKQFYQELLQNVTFKSFRPQSLIKINDQDDLCAFVVESGEVVVYERGSNQQKQINTLQRGDTFGLESFISGQMQDRLIYKTSGFVSLLVISNKIVNQILQKYPADLEIYWSLREQAQNEQIWSKCCICESKKHKSESCRQVHFIPDREAVIKRYTFDQNQNRSFYIRNRQRQKNFFRAYNDQELLSEAAYMVKIGVESKLLEKFQFEEITQQDSKEKNKTPQDSVTILIKDIDSNLNYSNLLSEKYQCYHHSEKLILNKQENSTDELKQEILYLQILQQKLKYQSRYSIQEINQIEEIVRFLEEKHLNIGLKDFEAQKDYANFKPWNNISSVIKKFSQNNMLYSSCSIESNQFQKKNRFLKYMFYPFEFFQQYRKNETRQESEDKIQFIRRNQIRISSNLYKKRFQKRYLRKTLQVYPII